ncbi:insulinase family protein [bacterium]|nr:insulinase family protein [bacterium]
MFTHSRFALGILGGIALVTSASAATGSKPNIQKFALPNGLRVFVIEDHSSKTFSYQTWFQVGSKDEKLDPALNRTGLAHLFEHMMFRGTAKHADGEFDKILTQNGVNGENATTWNDRTNYFQGMPSDKLELVMELESDRMVNLQIDQKLLDTERGAVLGELHTGLDEPSTVMSMKLYETAFTTHPYHFSTIGTEAEVQSFTKAEADYFYKTYYAPNNAVIIIAGDVDFFKLKKLVTKYYGNMVSQTIPRIQPPVEPQQTAERYLELQHAQIVQTKIMMGYHSPSILHADWPALNVALSMLTSGQGALLRKEWVETNLGSDMGGGLDSFTDPGLLELAVSVAEGHTVDELKSSLDSLLSGMTEASIEKEMDRAKNLFLLQFYQGAADISSLAFAMGEVMVATGNPMDYFDIATRVDAVKAADVHRVIKTYLIPENRTMIVGLPQAAAAPAPTQASN